MNEKEKTYTLTTRMINGLDIITHNIPESKKHNLENLSFGDNFIYTEDSDGVEICINMKHAVSVQYMLED